MPCACAVLYCHLWPVWLYLIFPHYLINGMISVEKLFITKCVFDCLCNFCLRIFHSEKNRARFDQKHILVFMWSTIYISQILVKIEFSRRIFQKYSNIKKPWKSVQWKPRCSMRTDGQTDMTKPSSLFSQFCERAWNVRLYSVFSVQWQDVVSFCLAQ